MIDFGKAFRYVFEDHQWIQKVLIGAALLFAAQMTRTVLAGVANALVAGSHMMFSPTGSSSPLDWSMMTVQIMGQVLAMILGFAITFFVWGSCARTFRNAIRGDDLPLAEWTDWMGDFVVGAKIFGVLVVYFLPVIALVGVLTAVLASSQGAGDILETVAIVGVAGISLVVLATLCVLPAPLMRFAATGEVRDAFDVGAAARLIFGNFAAYALALAATVIALVLSVFGALLFCIGIFATRYWAYLIATHAFAQVYRLYSPLALDSPESPQTVPPAHTETPR